MKKQVESRLAKLEGGDPERPFVVVFQTYDDPTLYTIDDRDGEELLTWDQVEERFSGYTIFRVVYDKNWRGGCGEKGDVS